MASEAADNVSNEHSLALREKYKGGLIIMGGGGQLTRDDFDPGPVSVDKIEENLYLGNLKAACDTATLHKLDITHILTVDAVPLPRIVTETTNVITKYIQIADVPKEDLISHFTETNDFIKQAQETGNVLVHCYYGMSRSAAVVIAYMMSRHGLTFEEAFYIVKAKRSICHPNSGFVAQLKLYGQMRCILDKDHPKYKQFRLRMAAENVRKVKILPQLSADLVKPDPGLTRERPDPLVYRCKKCRRIVASQKNIIPHVPRSVKLALSRNLTTKRQLQEAAAAANKCDLTCGNNGQILIEKLKSLACGNLVKIDANCEDLKECSSSLEGTDEGKEINITCPPDVDRLGTGDIASSVDAAEVCVQTYFVEPLAWMKDIHKNVQGKLHCPKCANKLGSFSWIMGCQCPCGVKVAPAFYLVPSKVEWSNVVQNVQVTV